MEEEEYHTHSLYYLNETPLTGCTLVILFGVVGVLLNTYTIYLLTKSKTSLFTRLIAIHQSFTCYINLAHAAWIPIKVFMLGDAYFLIDMAVSTIVCYSYNCVIITVFLLTFNRFLYVIDARSAQILDRNSLIVFFGIQLFPLLFAFIYPIWCSRPYVQIDTISFETYHTLEDDLCNIHERFNICLLGIVAVFLPIGLDLFTYITLQSKVARGKWRNAGSLNHKQLLLGLATCFMLHFLHSANFAFYICAIVLTVSGKTYFYLTTITWLVQNILESCVFIMFFTTAMNLSKRFVKQYATPTLF